MTRASRAASSSPSSWSKSQLRACCAISRRWSRLASRVTTFCKPAHLLVEIGAEPRQLLLVAQLVRLDDFVEAGGERLVVGLGRAVPVAPAGRGEHAFAQIVAGGRCPRRRPPSPRSNCLVGILVLDLLAAHLDVAAARRALVAFARPNRRLPPSLALVVVAAFLGLARSTRSSAAARSRSSSSRRDSLANAAWSSSVSASASSSAAALSSIQRRDEFEPGERGLGRRLAGQALARDQPDRGGQRHLLGSRGRGRSHRPARAPRSDARDCP